jgi:hypothetical protein
MQMSAPSASAKPGDAWHARLASLVAGCTDPTGGINRASASSLTPQAFTEQYLLANKPVLITGLIDEWRAVKEWVQHIPFRPNEQTFTAPSLPSTPAAATATASATPRSTLEKEHKITLKPRRHKPEASAPITALPPAPPSTSSAAASKDESKEKAGITASSDVWLRPTQSMPIPDTACPCRCEACVAAHAYHYPSAAAASSSSSSTPCAPSPVPTTAASPSSAPVRGSAVLSCCRARPNFAFLIDRFGHATVPVAHCSEVGIFLLSSLVAV